MENPIPGVLFALAFCVSFVMGGYFFSLTKITLNSFLTINMISLMNSIMTLNFLFFCICTSIGLGILLSIGSFYELKKAYMISMPAYLIAVLILTLGLNLTSFFVPLIVGLFAIPICFLSLKKSRELKIFPILRAGAYASSNFILVIGATFFLVLLFISITQATTLQNEFVPQVLSVTVGDGTLSLSDQISLQLAGAISTNQVNTIDLMLDQEEMKNMINSGSNDAINFKQKLLAYKQAYAGDDFKKQVSDGLKNQKIDFGTELLNKFPFLTTMAQYAFIIYPISAFILFIFIENLLIKNLAGLIFTAIVKIIPNTESTENKA